MGHRLDYYAKVISSCLQGVRYLLTRHKSTLHRLISNEGYCWTLSPMTQNRTLTEGGLIMKKYTTGMDFPDILDRGIETAQEISQQGITDNEVTLEPIDVECILLTIYYDTVLVETVVERDNLNSSVRERVWEQAWQDVARTGNKSVDVLKNAVKDARVLMIESLESGESAKFAPGLALALGLKCFQAAKAASALLDICSLTRDEKNELMDNVPFIMWRKQAHGW